MWVMISPMERAFQAARVYGNTSRWNGHATGRITKNAIRVPFPLPAFAIATARSQLHQVASKWSERRRGEGQGGTTWFSNPSIHPSNNPFCDEDEDEEYEDEGLREF